MSAEPSKPSSSASSTPQETPQPPPPAVAHYPPMPYNGHYPPPPGPYPPYYAYPVPDPSHHDPNAPNGAHQAVAPYYIPVPPPPPGMFYVVPPTAPGYPYATGIPPPQPVPKAKRKQVKMACTNCASACKRCDEARPCERCIKYGFAETCVDGIRKERKKGIKRGPYKRKNKTTGGEGSGGEGSSEAPAPVPPPPPPPPGYPVPPEGYPFPYVYPPMGYLPPPPDGQQHTDGTPNGAPAAVPPHPFYAPYPAMYPHPYVAASPAKSDALASASVSTTNGATAAEPTKGKKRARGKNGDESRAAKKAKEPQPDVQQPNGDAAVPKGTVDKDHPPPPTFAGHIETNPPVTAFNGPEPRPLMAAM
ncbi:hypothetical protein C8Q80DRAFT_1265868 [Daedaleopsis nitida]|nr:hypothetical protein C8Q80DRAFT_1265868 [Daedaleopsis nitida]